MATVFFDTNILLYAYDKRESEKQRIARALLEAEAVDEGGAISTQVVQEFCNVGLGKLAVSPDMLNVIIDDLLNPLLAHKPDIPFYKRAITLRARHQLSFYDALIVQAAIDLGCTTLYSEDLQSGQRFGALMVKNPFE